MMSFPITSKEILLQCIPQRDPIVMVDQLIQYSENQLIAGHLVKKDRLFTTNVLTEPGLIEHMAQSVALHTGYSYFIKQENTPVGYIGSISQLVINRLPEINENITTYVKIIQEFGGITLVDIVSKVEEEIIASGQMKTVIAK